MVDGVPYTGWLIDTDGKHYFFDKDGIMQTGWVKDDGNWYYMQNCRVSGAANKTVKPACGSWWYVSGWKIDFLLPDLAKWG